MLEQSPVNFMTIMTRSSIQNYPPCKRYS